MVKVNCGMSLSRTINSVCFIEIFNNERLSVILKINIGF